VRVEEGAGELVRGCDVCFMEGSVCLRRLALVAEEYPVF
jgi:hypothetical protein